MTNETTWIFVGVLIGIPLGALVGYALLSMREGGQVLERDERGRLTAVLKAR